MAFGSLVGELGKLIKARCNIERNRSSALGTNFLWPQSVYLPHGRLSLSLGLYRGE